MRTGKDMILIHLFVCSPSSSLLGLLCNWEFEPLVGCHSAVDDKHRSVLTKKFYDKNSFSEHSE